MYFPDTNLMYKSYDNDSGLDLENFLELQTASLDKEAAKVAKKLFNINTKDSSDFENDQELSIFKELINSNTKSTMDEEHSKVGNDKKKLKKKSPINFKTFKDLAYPQINNKKTTKNINLPDYNESSKFRFSDLVNENKSKIYIGREIREVYHGCASVSAKEIEYVSLLKTGRRTYDASYYDKNRMVIGHFWLWVEKLDEETQLNYTQKMTNFKSIKRHNQQSLPRNTFQSRTQTQMATTPRIIKSPFSYSNKNNRKNSSSSGYQINKYSTDSDKVLGKFRDDYTNNDHKNSQHGTKNKQICCPENTVRTISRFSVFEEELCTPVDSLSKPQPKNLEPGLKVNLAIKFDNFSESAKKLSQQQIKSKKYFDKQQESDKFQRGVMEEEQNNYLSEINMPDFKNMLRHSGNGRNSTCLDYQQEIKEYEYECRRNQYDCEDSDSEEDNFFKFNK